MNCEHGHRKITTPVSMLSCQLGVATNLFRNENPVGYVYFGMRLSAHGVGAGESQHELDVVLVGAVADHIALGGTVDVPQAFL